MEPGSGLYKGAKQTMALQTQVLENGRWVNRPMDLQYVLSRNQPVTSAEETSKMPSTARPPVTGILTRTIARSPIIKWIFPARIRHENKNDVVFVRDTSIELKEFIDGRYLQDVAFKSDFGEKIRSARILGAPRKGSDEPLPRSHLHAILKQEDELALEPMETDSQEPPKIPPQVLVVALQSSRGESLAFVYAYHGPSNHVQWACSRHELKTYTREALKLGSHIAVDPQ